MAQSPNTQLEGQIIEGLLCPICFQDHETISQLQEHVPLHSADDQDMLQTLKGFFGKAKRKILKKENEFEDYNRQIFDESGRTCDIVFQLSDYLALNQDLGNFVSHTPKFKELRDVRIDRYVTETNKLLIRLDRLITEAPDEPDKRKAHEKKIVPWIRDGDVRLCPGCAKSFGLPRRRHHCRLCGGVMCQACSKFIDFPFANKLLQPTFQDNPTNSIPSHSRSAPSTPMNRRESNTSLLSVVNFIGEPHLRICIDCYNLLARRSQQVERFAQKSVLVQKYERMQEYIKETDKLAPLYQKIVESLCSGETNYYLRDAQEVKVKLSKIAEGVDILSKLIYKLPPPEDGNTKYLQVQSKIRMSATQYLRDTVIGLPQPPTEEEVAQFKKLKEEQIQRRMQAEQESELQQCAKNMTEQHHPSANHLPKAMPRQKKELKSPVLLDSGWSASPIKAVPIEDNPMLEQINVIKQYIKQAKADNKYDEVHMLEKNLEELEAAYMQEKAMNSHT